MTQTDKSLVWITGLGHSGTSVVWEIFRRLGVVQDDQSEWGPVTATNTAIIEHYFGSNHPWWSLPMHHDPLPAHLVEMIRSTPLQPVVKDPRWSVTLHHWRESDPDRIPLHLIFLDREWVDCALSWSRGAIARGDVSLAKALESVKYRAACRRRCELPGTWTLYYPHCLLNPRTLIKVVGEITGLSRSIVKETVGDVIDLSRIHRYEMIHGGKVIQWTAGLPEEGDVLPVEEDIA